MTNILNYPLHNISPQTLRDLQEHYPNASVQIQLSETPQRGGLAEADFWDLIAQLDWSQEGNDTAVIEPVVQALTKAPLRHIYDFGDILSHKLYLLDTEIYVDAHKDKDILNDADFVADRFLYIRCCVVANGLSFFKHIQQNPTEMPIDTLFAPLLNIPNEAYRRKVGKPLSHIWAYPIETFSNTSGWASFDINKEI